MRAETKMMSVKPRTSAWTGVSTGRNGPLPLLGLDNASGLSKYCDIKPVMAKILRYHHSILSITIHSPYTGQQ